MTSWVYDPSQYTEKSFALIPIGDHRMRISDVVEKTFKSGNSGYEVTLDVSGYNRKLWLYLVLDPSNPAQTNQRLGEFFDCFGITDYSLGTGKQWIGKVGAARVKHELYNSKDTDKIHYLIKRDKQDELSPWQEPSSAGKAANAAAPVNEDVDLPDDLPFS